MGYVSKMQGLIIADQEALFVRYLVSEGLGIRTSATKAGYHELHGYRLVKKPAVAAAIHAAIQLELVSDLAPTALKIAATLLRDSDVSARVRADIAFKFLSLAGHVAPTERNKGPEKQISEMTREELFAYIARNEAEIQKIEGELAERAVDVSAPIARQPGMTLDAKPLNYLD